MNNKNNNDNTKNKNKNATNSEDGIYSVNIITVLSIIGKVPNTVHTYKKKN
jgi:hypothetical protein